MIMNSTSKSSFTVLPYISMNDVVRIKGDKDPTAEYLMVKKNPAKHIVRNIVDGKEYRVPIEILEVVRPATDQELDSLVVKFDALLRMGALATATSAHKRWTYAKDQKFVVIDVKGGLVKIVPFGGTEEGIAWRLPTASITVIPV